MIESKLSKLAILEGDNKQIIIKAITGWVQSLIKLFHSVHSLPCRALHLINSARSRIFLKKNSGIMI